MVYRTRRVVVIILAVIFAGVGLLVNQEAPRAPEPATPPPPIVQGDTALASDVLQTLPVKGRAPKTDYAREQFGAGWAEIDGCDMRNSILARDLTDIELDDDNCTVLKGTLRDPYTNTLIQFKRGRTTSDAVQIDHVVALSDAWQKGAQNLDIAVRTQFANDPLNLLAVDGPANQRKGDGDAASWLPPNTSYRCRYIARQIAVKQAYELWITQAEYNAMRRVLDTCPDQVLPIQVLHEQSNETTTP